MSVQVLFLSVLGQRKVFSLLIQVEISTNQKKENMRMTRTQKRVKQVSAD